MGCSDTGNVKEDWWQWCSEVEKLCDVSIHGCYTPPDMTNVTTVELHHFSDASYKAYGQCSYYLRIVDKPPRQLLHGQS